MLMILTNLRFAVRMLCKSPVYALVAIITLAVGIGANTAIFSITYALLLRQLPVPDPDRIVTVDWSGLGPLMSAVSGPMFDAITKSQSVFTGTCGWTGVDLAPSERGETRRVNGAYATADCFSTLQIQPLFGYLLGAADDQPGGGPYGWKAVISYDYWRLQYGADQGIIGRKLVVNGQPVTIAGVLPEGFHGLFVGARPAIIVPSEFEMVKDRFQMRHNQNSKYLQVFARLKPGVNRSQAQAQLRSVQSTILKQGLSPEELGNNIVDKMHITVEDGATGWGFLRRFMSPALIILHVIAGLLLMVISIDVGMLISARNATRRQELAVRSALGARRVQIVWQLFLENLLLACLGAGLGVAIAVLLDRALLAMLIRHDMPLTLDVGANRSVLAFTAGVATLAVFVFGLLPALRASKLDVASELKAGRGALVATKGTWLSQWLVPVQIAFSLTLVVVGSLFGSSFLRLAREHPGFRTDGVLLAPIDFGQRSEKGAALGALYREMLDRLANMPGIDRASFSELTPLSGSSNSRDLASTDAAGQLHSMQGVLFNNVAPNFFRVMGTNVLAGREFEASDTTSALKFCMLSDAAARYFFPGQNPIGRRVRPRKPADPADGWTVIGTVENVHSQNLRSADQLTVYFDAFQSSNIAAFPTFVIRSNDPASATRQFQQLVHETAPDTPMLPTVTLRDQVQSSVFPERILALLVTSFSAIALFLSAITLYGLLANHVARRTPEIGLRFAMGAQRGQILSLIMRQALRVVLPGVIGGTALALLAAYAVKSFLYGITAHDPWTLALAIAVTLATALIAILIPARRAIAIEPIDALRTE